MKFNIERKRFQLRAYPVPVRFANLLVEHDDLQGDVYWMVTVIFFWQAIQLWV